MASDQLVELFVDCLAGGSIDDVLVLVDELDLDLKRGRFILHDASNDVVGRLGSVVVTGELCTFIEDLLEKVGGELLLASFPDSLRDLPPHVGNEDDVLE